MIRTVLTAAAVLALAGVAVAAPKKPAAPPAPAPPAAPTAADWRIPDPNDVLVIDTNKGRIIVEMVPEVAPKHVVRMRELAREGFLDGKTFFRVIDGFMNQTGSADNTASGFTDRPNVPAEFTFRRGPEFLLAGDQTVREVGFVKSMAVASQSPLFAVTNPDGKPTAWPLYCRGVAGMARDQRPDSADTQFFLMRADYPKLEKNYTAWGQTLSGLEVIRAIKQGEPVAAPQDLMQRVRVLADIPASERPKIRVIDPKGAWFKAQVAYVKAKDGPLFNPCDIEIPAEVK